MITGSIADGVANEISLGCANRTAGRWSLRTEIEAVKLSSDRCPSRSITANCSLPGEAITKEPATSVESPSTGVMAMDCVGPAVTWASPPESCRLLLPQNRTSVPGRPAMPFVGSGPRYGGRWVYAGGVISNRTASNFGTVMTLTS